MHLTESVTPTICDKLATISFSDFKSIYQAETNKQGIKESDILTLYKRVRKYCLLAQSSNYNVKCTYKYADGRDSGRLFVQGPGIQSLPRTIRGALLDGVCMDFDMCNAHPSLLYYYCRQKQIMVNYLYQYVTQRKQILDNLAMELKISAADVKSLFLISINSNVPLDTYSDKKKIKNEFLLNFDREMKQLQNTILNNEENSQLVKTILQTNWKAKDNLGGCLVNVIMCNLENEVLQKAYKHCLTIGLNVDTFMFDGLTVRCRGLDPKIIIQQFDKITMEYGIIWDCKPHDISCKYQILSITTPQVITYCGVNILDIGKYLFDNYYKDRLYSIPSGDNITLFLKSLTNNIYQRGNQHITHNIKNWVCEQDLYYGCDGLYVPVNSNVKNVNEIVQRIIELAASQDCNNFIDMLFERSLYKLNFNNGVLHVTENKQTKAITIVFDNDPAHCEGLFKIPYDFIENPSQDILNLKQQIYDLVLNPIFATDGTENMTASDAQQLRDCILYRMARACFGFYMDKNWFKVDGSRNSGKGVLCDLLRSSLGDYVQSISASNFIAKPQNGNDSARNYMFLADQSFTRVLYTNEFETNIKDKTVVQGALIKSVCSGGDVLEVRQLHKNAIKIKLQCAIMMFANEYPEFQPNNCLDTCTIWSMPTKFINTEDKARLPGYKYVLRDDSIKQFVQRLDVGHAFIHILLDSIRSGYVEYPKLIKEEIDCQNEISTTEVVNPCALIVEYSANCDDKVTTKDLIKRLNQAGYAPNFTLIKSYMQLLNMERSLVGKSRVAGYKNCVFIS
jgi:hypothetical protein